MLRLMMGPACFKRVRVGTALPHCYRSRVALQNGTIRHLAQQPWSVYQQQYAQRTNQNIQKWVLFLLGAGGIGYGLWWLYWPKHTFPSSVAAILRKALWAESEKEDFNYKSAISFYKNALEECDRLHMDNTSDEYTGIEIKIAEMYEKMGLLDEANGVYLELLYRFYDALTIPDRVPDQKRPDLIRRDLRVLIKSLETNKDIGLGKRNLLAHLLLVQEEILMRSPELQAFFEKRKKKKSGFVGDSSWKTTEDFAVVVNDKNIKINEEGHMILDLQKDSSAWEPFKEEFFTARDLYTAYCLSANDIAAALSCKATTVEWMLMADMPAGQVLLSQANLGSLLYLQGEKFEAQIFALDKKVNNEPALKEDSTAVKALRTLHKNRDTCLQMATQCYDSVVRFSKNNLKMRFNLQEQLDPAVAQAIALSTYGMGVLNLHKENLPKAEHLLKDSIMQAKSINFSELLKEAENELQKLNAMKEQNSAAENLVKS